MPGKISARSTTRVRRIFPAPESERRRAGRTRFGKFHRDAEQDRLKNVPCKKETGSFSGSSVAGDLPAALRHGHVHANSLRKSERSRTNSELNCLYRARIDNSASRLSGVPAGQALNSSSRDLNTQATKSRPP